MILRRFNAEGVKKFQEYLASARQDAQLSPPRELLQDESLTENVGGMIKVERRSYSKRRDAAVYLVDLLAPLDDEEVRNDAGLWTWLALFFFDEVCPPRDGKRKIRNDYLYIYQPQNQRHFYRHLLFLAWRVLKVAPTHNRLFLDLPISVFDKVSETVFRSLYITRIPCIFEALDLIYWDGDHERVRKGIVDPRKVTPGSLRHRLPVRIRQLEKTFDLQSLNADQLIELLGDEFKSFATAKNRTDGELVSAAGGD